MKNFLHNKRAYTEALFSRPDSLSALLPYDEYLTEHQVFILKDGSLGAVFEVDLVAHEPLTESQILRVVKSTKNWFNIPENCVLQIYYDCATYSKGDEKIANIDASYPDSHPVSKMLFDKKMENLKAMCEKGGAALALKRSLLISLRYFPQYLSKAQLKDLTSSREPLARQTREFKKDLSTFLHYVKNLYENYDLKITALDQDKLGIYLRKFFNPRTFYKRDFAPVNPRLPLSDQIIFNTPTLSYDGLKREGLKTRTLTLKTSPAFSYPGGMANFVNIEFPFRLALNFSFPSSSKVKKFFAAKEFFLENAMTAKAKLQKEEIKAVQEMLARDDRCLHMTFNIVLDGETEAELDEKTRKVCHIFNNQLECEVIEEDDIGLGLCLNILPLNYSADADYSTRRAIRILKSDAMRFIPLFDSFKGLDLPLAVYLSREGNVVPFSLLENETSNHTVVLADTGAGKSAFVVDCIQAAKRLSPEPIVFVIDKKSSYGMLSQYYGGDLTIFERGKDIPFSPFRGLYNEDKIAFLTKMVILAIKLTSPNFVPESEHQSAIAKAMKIAYLKKCENNGLEFVDGGLVQKPDSSQVMIDMNDLVIELGSLVQEGLAKEMIQTLCAKLKPFYGDGIYAQFFNGRKASDGKYDKLFYVYDLDALDSDPVLQSLMTMSVIEEIRCILSLPQNQGRTGFLVMEEFAMLGRNNPAFRDFAIDFAETMRKRGCWLITLTPRPQNYFDLEVGKAFWGVADNFIFLQMSSDNVDYIAEKSSLLDEASTEIIRSLRTKRGQYSDVFYMNKSKTKHGAFRYRQTSYDRWMCPTNPMDSMQALNALATYPNKWEALEYLAGGAASSSTDPVVSTT